MFQKPDEHPQNRPILTEQSKVLRMLDLVEFDKAIYISLPIDWITSSPNKAQRILTLRPITRDGGANLGSARSLNKHIQRAQNAAFQREFGRLWK